MSAQGRLFLALSLLCMMDVALAAGSATGGTSNSTVIPASTIGSSMAAGGAASFGLIKTTFFLFCKFVGLSMAARSMYGIYEMGHQRNQETGHGWSIFRMFLVSVVLFYLQGFLGVLHNTFPGLFPNL